MTIAQIQQQASKLVTDSQADIVHYFALHKLIENLSEGIPDYFKKPKLAFLSNFTIQGLPAIVRVRGIFHNLWAETYLAPYNQYAQEILNLESGFYKFKADVVYLLIDLESGLNLQFLTDIIDQLLLRTNAKIVVFHREIADHYQANRSVLFFDFLKWLKASGHEKNWDTKYKDLGDLRLTIHAFPDLAESLLSYAVAVSGATKKCVVMDLDNTLWSGILGEDGFDKIVPDRKLQEFLLKIYNRGIMLAINSRNNLDEVMEAIEKHPRMILRKKNFSAWKINWSDKTANMIALAKELNLGIDSFVFIDDDLFQQNLIRETIPSIAVIPAQNNEELLKFLERYAGFSVLELTPEDIKRAQMYTQERSRKELFSRVKTVEDFLKELRLKLVIVALDEATLARAAQLTQKTNQFNLTTRRYSEEQLKKFLVKGWKIWTVKAKDKFGDYGTIGLVMVEPKEKFWRVDNFLLSCRILGRDVEKQVADYLKNQACKNQSVLTAEYVPTSRNQQTEDFWREVGFEIIEESSSRKLYRYDASSK